MIVVKNKKQCCGCTACTEICPVHCIDMASDKEGFKYPKADSTKCISCGACERACPIINYQRRVSFQEQAYLVQNRNKLVLKESTSGGAFTAIAEYVIKHNGIVYGATMDPDTLFVHHQGIDNTNELYRFRNSKYVQSDMETCYQEAREYLKNKRLVCFSGTPCQIEGFIQFLGNNYKILKENLILVDVVCRAVPSPGIWKKYTDQVQKDHGRIKSVRFRDKELGYQYSTMVIQTEDGTTQREAIESSLWLRMFFSGIIIRPSCTQCKFRSPYRKSDITLWDCFPTYRFDKKIDEDDGTTRVLVHSETGIEVFNEIKSNLSVEEVDVKKAIANVREMRLSPSDNKKRHQFYDEVNSVGIKAATDKYFPSTKKQEVKKEARQVLHKAGLDKTVKHILKKG